MSVAAFRLYFDNQPVADEQLDLFDEIRVDQAIGMAGEAELQMSIGVDEQGYWSGMEEQFARPFQRIRVEVQIGEGDFVPLIDGSIVGHRYDLDASPNASSMVIVVQDDGMLLNQEEKVTLFEGMQPDEIASQLFREYGLDVEADSVASSAGGLERYVVQRGTAMQLLKELARRHGMYLYIRPGDSPGRSIGVFQQPDLSSADYPELLLLGRDRNINRFSARFDGLRPTLALAGNVDITNQDLLSSEASQPELEAQGDVAVHSMLEPATTLLSRTRELSDDLDAATTAAVDHSSWAYSANAEVSADIYAGVLSPHRVITVTGAGGYLSGNWLITQVTHVIDAQSYKQEFSLRRNARSEGQSADSNSLGSVF
ncbi:MAG: hypothetical protein SV201_08505 [Pseudomonadota bacterium]|nr:hypothetical protein [Pseudomonadota bacterium]